MDMSASSAAPMSSKPVLSKHTEAKLLSFVAVVVGLLVFCLLGWLVLLVYLFIVGLFVWLVRGLGWVFLVVGYLD